MSFQSKRISFSLCTYLYCPSSKLRETPFQRSETKAGTTPGSEFSRCQEPGTTSHPQPHVQKTKPEATARKTAYREQAESNSSKRSRHQATRRSTQQARGSKANHAVAKPKLGQNHLRAGPFIAALSIAPSCAAPTYPKNHINEESCLKADGSTSNRTELGATLQRTVTRAKHRRQTAIPLPWAPVPTPLTIIFKYHT